MEVTMKKLLLCLILPVLFAGFIQAQPCSPAVEITMPFTKDGAGHFCFVTTCIAAPINSWNLTRLSINGVDFTNRWADCPILPEPIDGKYYIEYDSTYAWGHFEATGSCCGGVTAAPTNPPTTPPTDPPSAPPTATPTPAMTGYTLVISTGASMTGTTVSINPPGATYSYPATVSYDVPTVVTVTANNYQYPDGAVNIFTGWQGAYTGSTNPLTITVDKLITLTAVYVHGDPTPPPTATPTAVITPVPQSPIIDSLNPTSGTVGTLVTINGSGFAASGNTIIFQNAITDFIWVVQITAGSQDGKTLQFSVPAYLNPYCYYTVPACASPSTQTTDGPYFVSVTASGVTSNVLQFTVTGASTPNPTAEPTPQITVMPPTASPTPTPTPSVTSTPTAIPTPIGGTSTPPPAETPTPEVNVPTPTPIQPVSDPGAGMVWFGTAADSLYLPVQNGSIFSTSVGLCTGSQVLGAYAFDVSYDAAAIAVDTSIGTGGVEALPDGFVSAVNPNTPGILTIAGFDTTGKGPFYSASILRINWKALSVIGVTRLGLTVSNLVDLTTATIGISPTPRSGIGATIDVY